MTQTIQLMDGFEDFATADLALQGYDTSNVSIVSGSNSGFTGARSGSRYAVGGNQNAGRFSYAVPSSDQFWSVGFGFWYLGANNPLFALRSGATVVCSWALDGGGHFTFYSGNLGTLRATSTATIPTGWFHIAFVIKLDTTSGGYMNIHLNGNPTPIVSFTGITAVTASSADSFSFAQGGWAGGQFCAVDDVIIATGDAGSAALNYFGDLAVASLYPSAAGTTTQMTPLSGSNWDAVNDAQEDGDSTYVEDSVSGHKDTYAMTDPALTGTVVAIQPVYVAKKDVAGTVSFHGVTRLSGTEVSGTSIFPSTSYAVYKPNVYTTKPGGGAWSTTDLTNMEAGQAID